MGFRQSFLTKLLNKDKLHNLELGMGIEPSRVGDKTLGFGVWRYRRYSFFAASFPFFFLREIRFHKHSLSGEKTYESKIRNRRIRTGTLAKIKKINRENREMPTMRLHTFLERCTLRRSFSFQARYRLFSSTCYASLQF